MIGYSERSGVLGPPGVPGLSRWGWGSAKPRPERQDLLAGRSADHDTLEVSRLKRTN